MKRSNMLSLILFAVSLGAGCGEGGSRDRAGATIPPDLTLDEVYDRMERAIDGGADRVLHASVVIEDLTSTVPTPEWFDGFNAKDYGEQVWIDAARGVARVETRTRYQSESRDRVSRAIVREDGTFRVDSEGRNADVDSLTCRGSDSVLLTQVMRCGNYLEKSSTTVEPGEYGGRPAIVLFTTGTLPSEDWTSPFENRLYVDPSSYLPIAMMASETSAPDAGYPGSFHIRTRYDVEFVDRSSLPGDFFEPAGIGYVQNNPAANLRADVDGMRAYWLGREFDGTSGAPPLVLFRVGVPTRQVPPGYRLTASYEQKGGKRNYPVLDLQEYPTDAWKALHPDTGGHIWNDAGVIREDVQIPGGRAVLFRVPASYERYVAHVYFDTTVILIADADSPSPYSNREAMIDVIKSLRPYQ